MRVFKLWKHLLAALILALVAIGSAGVTLAEGPQDREAREIAATLDCPVCQGQSVADSPAPMAQQMRGLIVRKLAEGQTRDQIRQYFVDRYGQEILRDSPDRVFNRVVGQAYEWLPWLVLAAGAVVIAVILYRGRSDRRATPTPVARGIPEARDPREARLEKEPGRKASGTPKRAKKGRRG